MTNTPDIRTTHDRVGLCVTPNHWVGTCRCCDSAARLCPRGYCLLCLARGLNRRSVPKLRKLRIEAENFLSEGLGMTITRDYEIHMLAYEPYPPNGVRLNGRCEVIDGETRVMVREGLPEPVFYSVLIHELVHVWQSENCPEQSLELAEGVATWVEWKALKELDSKVLLETFEEQLYGVYLEGFKACLKAERKLGEVGFLEAARSWTDFPWKN